MEQSADRTARLADGRGSGDDAGRISGRKEGIPAGEAAGDAAHRMLRGNVAAVIKLVQKAHRGAVHRYCASHTADLRRTDNRAGVVGTGQDARLSRGTEEARNAAGALFTGNVAFIAAIIEIAAVRPSDDTADGAGFFCGNIPVVAAKLHGRIRQLANDTSRISRILFRVGDVYIAVHFRNINIFRRSNQAAGIGIGNLHGAVDGNILEGNRFLFLTHHITEQAPILAVGGYGKIGNRVAVSIEPALIGIFLRSDGGPLFAVEVDVVVEENRIDLSGAPVDLLCHPRQLFRRADVHRSGKHGGLLDGLTVPAFLGGHGHQSLNCAEDLVRLLLDFLFSSSVVFQKRLARFDLRLQVLNTIGGIRSVVYLIRLRKSILQRGEIRAVEGLHRRLKLFYLRLAGRFVHLLQHAHRNRRGGRTRQVDLYQRIGKLLLGFGNHILQSLPLFLGGVPPFRVNSLIQPILHFTGEIVYLGHVVVVQPQMGQLVAGRWADGIHNRHKHMDVGRFIPSLRLRRFRQLNGQRHNMGISLAVRLIDHGRRAGIIVIIQRNAAVRHTMLRQNFRGGQRVFYRIVESIERNVAQGIQLQQIAVRSQEAHGHIFHNQGSLAVLDNQQRAIVRIVLRMLAVVSRTAANRRIAHRLLILRGIPEIRLNPVHAVFKTAGLSVGILCRGNVEHTHAENHQKCKQDRQATLEPALSG